MKLRLHATIFLLLFLSPIAKSQTDFFKRLGLSVTVFNHSVGIPFKDFFKTPMNFGVTAAAEFTYNNNFNSPVQRLEFGWYHHANLNTAIWVKTDYVRRFRAKNGWYGEFQGGLGYMRDYVRNETFILQKDGTYKNEGKSSQGGLLVAVGAGAGYQIDVNDKYSITPFLRYEGMIQYPYGKLLPFFPHSLLHLGTRFRMAE